jgi:RNA polymerase sigma factor (sigma-70 family)
MPTRTTDRLARQLRRSLLAHAGDGLPDGDLLEAFVTHRDEAAFAVLVRRHGPMVLGVCRRVIGNVHDAEDAFQATFLVLAHRAAAVEPRSAVGAWLHGVAHRTARRARVVRLRRLSREKPLQGAPHPATEPQSLAEPLSPVLDEELQRLPERLRVAVILCDLQGRSRREAASQLGLPEGTLSSRLATARKLLAQRLARRGVGPAGVVPLAVVPPALAARAIDAVGGLGAATVPNSSAALAAGVMRAMNWTRFKVAALLLAVVLFGAGAVPLLCSTLAQQPEPVAPKSAAQSGQQKQDGKPAKKSGEPDWVWALDLRYKDPRPAVLREIPGRDNTHVWYLWYEVANFTGEPRTFIPDFELVVDGQAVRHEEVLPSVVEALEKIEDPQQKQRVKDSVSIAGKPIPALARGASGPWVAGVAVWTDVPADGKKFTVSIHGLSNGWMMVDGKSIRRKTLVLHFERQGNNFRQLGEAKWEYRTVRLKSPG